MAAEESTLESLLNRATNPTNKDDNWEAIRAFASRINQEQDQFQTATRLLAHKIQSPQEREAMQALIVLENCARTCGKRFHTEIGKFRFLNEMIKLVSPKYLGSRTSPKVKRKVIEILYMWTREIQQESKIGEAYQMLKHQEVIKEDPTYLDQEIYKSSPTPRQKNAIFDDDEKSKLLQRLLQSKNPDDLQAANRLIKTMVKEDEKRMEKVSRRVTELETVNNNVKVLGDMLTNYKPGVSSSEEVELMKELFQSCEQLRPNLFRLASEMGDKEEGIAEILKANDELSKVMGQFRITFGEVKEEDGTHKKPDSAGISLLDLGSPFSEKSPPQSKNSSDILLLDDQLLGIDDGTSLSSVLRQHSRTSSDASSQHDDLHELGEIFSKTLPSSNASILSGSPFSNPLGMDGGLLSATTQPMAGMTQPLQPVSSALFVEMSKPVTNEVATNNKLMRGMDDLDALGQNLLKASLPPTLLPGAEFPKDFSWTSVPSKVPGRAPEKVPLNQMSKKPGSSSNPSSPALQRATFGSGNSSVTSSPTRSPAHDALSLAGIFVSLDSIQPSAVPPNTLYDKNGVNVVLHHGKNIPRPDVSVMVVTTISKNPEPVKNFVFQAAVPKVMRVKLQPPSATSLPGYNPILPPAAITQIMLIANPAKEKVRLKYKVSYTHSDLPVTDIGEIDSLPLS